MMRLSRRNFLKSFFAAAGAASINVPAAAKDRPPYVSVGDAVDHIGPAGKGSRSFSGGKIVKEIKNFDGAGYLCVLRGHDRKYELYYDIDLANFRKEVPDDFWHYEENRKTFNNVHEYVRLKRYGETVEQARRALNFYSSRVI